MSMIQDRLQSYKDQLFASVEETTALRIRYDSLSPNLFGGIRLSGVTICDALSDQSVLSVDRLEVNWSLRHLNFKNTQDILSHIKSVNVDGLSVDWDNEAQNALIQKLLSLAAPSDSVSDNGESSGFSLSLPFIVQFHDLTLHYRQNGFSVLAQIPQIKLTPKKNGETNISFNGHTAVSLEEKLFDLTDSFSVDFKARGVLTESLTGSTVQLELTGCEGDVIRLGTTSLSVALEDSSVRAILVSAKQPYSLQAFYDFTSQAAAVAFTADGFQPLKLMTVTSSSELLQNLKAVTVSGTYRADCIVSAVPELLDSLQYEADGTIFLPDELIPGGMAVSTDIQGTARELFAHTLSVDSPDMALEYTGSFNFSELVPEGELSINRLVLPSGKDLETLFYIDRLPQGFVLFAPQIYIEDLSLTAVQIECRIHDSSVDFSLEASDYSHYETETPGELTASGFASWNDSIDLQAQIGLNSFFADSIARITDCFLPAEQSLDESIYDLAEPYILSLDLYAATDFNSIVYNLPYIVVANTRESDQMLLLSLGGNETTVSVSQLNLLYEGIQVNATVSMDSDDSYDQIFFGADLQVNDMPYSLSGAFIDKQYITVQGDYQLDAALSLDGRNGITGSLLFEMLPVHYDSYFLQASADTAFEYRSLHDFSLQFNRLFLSETSGTIRTQPVVTLTGLLNQWGMTLNDFIYEDTVDAISGNGFVSWSLESDVDSGQTILSEASCAISARNGDQKDAVTLEATFMNPLLNPFTADTFISDSYVVAQCELYQFCTAHLLDGQTDAERINATVTVQGSLENPSVYAAVPAASALLGGTSAFISLEAALEDRVAAITNGSFSYSDITLDQTDVSFSLSDMTGHLSSTAAVHLSDVLNASTPFTLDVALGKDSIQADLLIENLISDIAPPIENYPISLQRGGGVTAVTAGWTNAVQAVYLDSGDFIASATAEFPLLFSASGTISGKELSVKVQDITLDLSVLSQLVDFDEYSLYGGILTGSAVIGGQVNDPEFSGTLFVSNMSMGVPDYIGQPIIAGNVVIAAHDNSLEIRKGHFTSGGAAVIADITCNFERWSFDNLIIDIEIPEGNYVDVTMLADFIDLQSEGRGTLHMVLDSTSFTIEGTIYARNGDVVINNGFLEDEEEVDSDSTDMIINCDVKVIPERKVKVAYPSRKNPIIRGLATTETPFIYTMDGVAGTYTVIGNLEVRGGEILYLNRNFYLREGSVILNENENGFNPLINLRAETRERTADNELVRIILSIPNQRLDQIDPVLSSDSSLSDLEIRTLLGEAILVESGISTGAMLSQLAASGVDYLIQNSLIRGLENRLRDSLHFDIFSIRSPFIQQALQSVLDGSDTNDSLKIGNYFDNTTVYIGKYIGTSVYMDAMFSLRFDEEKRANTDQAKLTFALQPEIGLEFPAPFANIRWSIAPDVTQSVQNLWVPYTSLSLSWKLSL